MCKRWLWIVLLLVPLSVRGQDDWLRAAYQGLHNRQGDCYVYQMTSKVLLDAAGIENRLIDTMPLRYLHCWNLVNIGEGWYHFDACKT